MRRGGNEAAWTDLSATTSFAALADVLERHLGATATNSAGSRASGILAHVTEAVSACEGPDGALRHPLSAHFLTAVAPG